MKDRDDDMVGWMRRTFEGIPVVCMLGARPTAYDAESGRVSITYEAKPEFCNLIGTVQGGILTAMLDNVMSFAALCRLELGHAVPTLEIKTTFVTPAKPGPILGEAVALRLGRSVAFLEGRLSTEDGTLLAVATSTAQVRRVAKR